MVLKILGLILFPALLTAQLPTPREIATRGRAAVVRVTAFSNGEEISQGSGFLVTPDGRLVTNFHVIRGADRLTVQLQTGRVYDRALFVSADEQRDLAILRIPDRGLPTVTLSDDRSAAVGDRVYVIGNPLGLDGTFSDGLVSGRRQVEGVSLLQISAPISPGSSGGPVLNASGQVIGIATLTSREGQNLNLAVPSRYAQGLLAMNDEPRPLDQVPGVLSGYRSTATSAGTEDGNKLEPWARQLLSEVRAIGDAAAKAGLVATHEPMVDMLEEGEAAEFTYTFRDRGAVIGLIGVCDGDCSDLDLAIYDGNGKLIIKDSRNDDRPFLEFTVLSPGTFTVRAYMAECDPGPCALAIQSYSRPKAR